MARIDHSFSIDKPPDVAQAMFVRDIAPELARDRDFEIASESPGRLIFSDGFGPGSNVDPNFEESTQERDDREGPDAAFSASLMHAPADLPSMFPRHIQVDFSAEVTGTRVRVHGHVERDVRHGLELLGTPKHWPEIADQPHD
jgi:hypothetical protein